MTDETSQITVDINYLDRVHFHSYGDGYIRLITDRGYMLDITCPKQEPTPIDIEAMKEEIQQVRSALESVRNSYRTHSTINSSQWECIIKPAITTIDRIIGGQTPTKPQNVDDDWRGTRGILKPYTSSNSKKDPPPIDVDALKRECRDPLPKIEGLRAALKNVCEPHGEWFLWCGEKYHADALIKAARAYLEASEVGHLDDINVADMEGSK